MKNQPGKPAMWGPPVSIGGTESARVSANLAELLDIGFHLAGCWELSGNGITFNLKYLADYANVVYAFAVEGELVYIGKSGVALRARMQAYQSPAKAAKNAKDTNSKNNIRIRIREQLTLGNRVEIYACMGNTTVVSSDSDLAAVPGLTVENWSV